MKWRLVTLASVALLLALGPAALGVRAETVRQPGTGHLPQADATPTPTSLFYRLTATPRFFRTPATTATPEALPETGATPTPPTATPEPGGPLTEDWDPNLLPNYAQFDSYRIETTVGWDLDDGRVGEAEIITEVTHRPHAQRWTIEIQPEDGPRRALEVIQADGQTYHNAGAGWGQVPPAVTLLLRRVQWAMEPRELLDMQQGRFVRREMVNGLEAERYRYGFAAFEPGTRHVELDSASATVWVSRELEVYVRLVLRMMGSDALGNSGEMTMVSNLVAVNEPITIEQPMAQTPVDDADDERAEADLILHETIGLQTLDSYRLESTLGWRPEGALPNTARIAAVVAADQPAERATIRVTSGILGQRLEYLNVGRQAYARQNGRWQPLEKVIAPDILAQVASMGNPRTFLDARAGTLVGVERLDGVNTQHYRFGREAFSPVFILATIQEARADLWYSPRHDAYLRVTTEIRGNDRDGRETTVTFTSEVTDIGAPITIEEPEELSTTSTGDTVR